MRQEVIHTAGYRRRDFERVGDEPAANRYSPGVLYPTPLYIITNG
jgi:hypothetical protein